MEKNIYSPSYYQILEIQVNATAEQIKAARRKLMKIYHEDLNPDNKEAAKAKSQLINEAYEVLSDLEKRTKYDEALNSFIKAGEERIKRHKASQQENNKKHRRATFNPAVIGIIILLAVAIIAIISTGKSNNPNG